MPLFARLLTRQFIFLFGGIWALVGTPLIGVAVWAYLAKPREEKLLVLVFGILGLIFGGSGWVMVALSVRKASREAALVRSGLPVQAEVLEVVQSAHVRVNNRFPWYLRYRFRAVDGTERVEESSYLAAGAEGEWKKGSSLTVLCDPSDASVFMPDVEHLR